MSGKVYLVTGANRGIGLGLTKDLLNRPNTTIVAAVRKPASAGHLSELPTASGSKVIVVKIDSEVDSDPAAAVKDLQSQHGISHLDIVIANSGISEHYAPAATTSLDEGRRHLQVNFLAPIALFQATLPLLKKSSDPKFVGITSGAGSMTNMESIPLPVTMYGGSKAALNFFLRKAHFENPKVTIYPLNPGWVQIDMGRAGANAAGLEEAPVTLQDSVDSILKNIDNATREKTSGTFQSADKDTYDW